MKLGMQRAKWRRGLVHLIINGVHLTAVWVDVVDVYLIWEVSVALYRLRLFAFAGRH
jgi:hypothetical protein